MDLLVNASPDLIINIDLTGKIKFWNQAAEQSTGFTAGEMMDKKLVEPLHKEADELTAIFVASLNTARKNH